MDALIETLSNLGGGYLTAAVTIALLIGGIKIAQILLRREWDRSDRQASQIDRLVESNRKQTDAMEDLLAGQRILLDRRER